MQGANLPVVGAHTHTRSNRASLGRAPIDAKLLQPMKVSCILSMRSPSMRRESTVRPLVPPGHSGGRMLILQGPCAESENKGHEKEKQTPFSLGADPQSSVRDLTLSCTTTNSSQDGGSQPWLHIQITGVALKFFDV